MNTLESDNDRHAAELAAKVSRLKNVRYKFFIFIIIIILSQLDRH